MVICDDAVITHELTVRFAEDGSFQYLGNEILNNGIMQIPDYQYRIKEWFDNNGVLWQSYRCKTREETEKEFDGKGYGDFKLAVGEAVAAELEPLQKRYGELMADKTYLDSMIKMNDEKAAYYSNKTLRKVQKKVGLTERIR